ncbi:MAG: hypothetical protein KatS3mg069_1109 [Meiothermus sp.]|nr:MAG: hypothetical protein KatS3mg069_1109 [Meiothermus sp.]
MLNTTIAAFCIIDDLLPLLGHKDDQETKTPSSVILTLAVLSALHTGGNHKKTLAFAKDFALFSHLPSPSRFGRRIHPLQPYLLALLPLLSRLWRDLHQAQGYALDTFPWVYGPCPSRQGIVPLPLCENIWAPRCRLAPERVYRGYIPSQRVYFYGFKLHVLEDDGFFAHEVALTPGACTT